MMKKYIILKYKLCMKEKIIADIGSGSIKVDMVNELFDE